MHPQQTSPQKLTIGKLAAAAEINVETIRYYQRTGLIQEPVKPASGYRIYPETTLQRILFIKRAQRLGFTLKEIEELLELGSNHCTDIREKAELKRDLIQQQINDLQALQSTLNSLIDSCCHGHDNNCPIVESLSKQ